MTLKGYTKAGTVLFFIPLDYKGVTQQGYIPIALQKAIIFWVIGGILLVFGRYNIRRVRPEGPKG